MIVETVEKVNPGPAPLRELCSRGVGEQVVRVLWRGQLRFQTIYIPEPVERGLREWLEAVPQCLRQDLLDRSYSLLFSTIGQVTEMCSSTVPIMLASVMESLYSPALKHLEIWTDFHWHQEARLKVLHLLHSQESFIKTLNFACYKTPIFQFQALSFSERFLLMNVLNKFSDLRQLIIPYVADDDMLGKLGQGCCPQLESLDVQGSWEVTNQGLAELSGHQGQMVVGRVGWVPSHFTQCSEAQRLLDTMLKGSPVSASQLASIINQNTQSSQTRGLTHSLRSLNVTNTAIDWKGVQTVLQNFVNLRRLEADEQHWQSLMVSLNNDSLACRDCLPRNLPLRRINLSRHTYSLMEALSRSLPNLEHLHISNFERSEPYLDGIDHLPLLHSFAKLSSLSLQDVDMDQFYHYFAQGGGQNIRSLSYVNTSRHRALDLARLDPLCPQLTELTVGDSLISYKPELTRDSTTFTALRSLALKDISMEGDQGCWKRMVKRSSNLRRLTLHNIRMTDADMTDILAYNPLKKIEELNISATGSTINLSEDTIYKLIEKCPRLTKIGGVCGWSSRDIVTLLETLNNKHNFRIKMDDRD